MNDSRQTVVPFDASGLGIKSIVLVALPSEFFLDPPWPRPDGRIVDRDLVFERARPGTGPALDKMQVRAARRSDNARPTNCLPDHRCGSCASYCNAGEGRQIAASALDRMRSANAARAGSRVGSPRHRNIGPSARCSFVVSVGRSNQRDPYRLPVRLCGRQPRPS
jgi:hypothetical protein